MGNTGYNDLAVLNNIIMVYPDTRCWDNEGDIDSGAYNTNSGDVVQAIKSMIDRVTGGTTNDGNGNGGGDTGGNGNGGGDTGGNGTD